WILGASDPEMELVEKLLRKVGETVAYAVDANGERVRGGTAYRDARAAIPEGMRTAFLVECDVPLPDNVERVVVDHHRPGDPGYGKGPAEFLPASSIGQVLSKLACWGLVGGVFVRSYADDPEAPIPGTERPKLGEIRTIPQDNAPFLWAVFIPGVGWLYVDKELVLAA